MRLPMNRLPPMPQFLLMLHQVHVGNIALVSDGASVELRFRNALCRTCGLGDRGLDDGPRDGLFLLFLASTFSRGRGSFFGGFGF